MKVINRIASRLGKAIGSDRAAARLTAPRIPAHPMNNGTEGGGCGSARRIAGTSRRGR